MAKSNEVIIAVEKYKSKKLSKRVKHLEAVVESQHEAILALGEQVGQILTALNAPEEEEEEEPAKVGFAQAPTQEEE
tara:strand:+ start:11110 stop:11340 length:231 start_codon:yes stop_codon:yes gene_type:complete